MNGLKNNNTDYYIMNKWHDLFIEQNKIHSDTKYKYWKNAQQCGIPNINDEKWKYIPLNKLFSHKFVNTSSNHNIQTSERDSLSLNFDSYRLVFVNGFFSKQLSNQDISPWKITIVNRHVDQILPKPIQPEFFIYLNECLSYETIYISLPNNIISKIPLYLLHINQGNNNQEILTTFCYRHHIKIHDNASGHIIEHYASTNKDSYYFNNSRMSIVTGSNTKIEHTKISSENRKSYHISHNDIHANYNSTIQSNIFNICSSHFIRHQTSVFLNEKLSFVSLNSLILPLKQDTNDISTYIKHNSPGYSSSKQVHKIILGNQGQGIFRGLIQVSKKAIKINGKMINNNLLLDQLSKIYSMPQLEIYSNDVACTHGTTIGYINNEQIFYLRTRGIPYKQACQMIIYAFSFEIIRKITNNHIQKQISDRVTNIITRIFYNGISHTKNSI